VFNESDGIKEFLFELNQYLSDFDAVFIVVNDCSTDGTGEILSTLKHSGFPIQIISNSRNFGHGFSVMAGLRHAASQGFSTIVTCDGDGQFLGSDIRSLVLSNRESGLMTEGVRIGRSDPIFRTTLSLIIRLLVWMSTFKLPRDANTPLRVMTISDLNLFLDHLHSDCKIPNLAIGAFARAKKRRIVELDVESIPPRRRPGFEDHWKMKSRLFPSKKFIFFSITALSSWIKVAKTIKKSFLS
jgi:glycosyltransferase involved in cell wall biosynthesis